MVLFQKIVIIIKVETWIGTFLGPLASIKMDKKKFLSIQFHLSRQFLICIQLHLPSPRLEMCDLLNINKLIMIILFESLKKYKNNIPWQRLDCCFILCALYTFNLNISFLRSISPTFYERICAKKSSNKYKKASARKMLVKLTPRGYNCCSVGKT
jgi:hypothetical protein